MAGFWSDATRIPPSCSNAARVAEKNRVTFDSEAAAVKAGYRPGKDCHK
jgi:methylphosphotriester-DNA--protein-cysteine methyltransferase